jgi:hypothetical protein
MLTRLKGKMRVIFPSAVKISGGDEPRIRNWMSTVRHQPRIRNRMSTVGDKPWIWNWVSTVSDEPGIRNWVSSVRYQPRIRNWMSTVGHDRCRAWFCTVSIRDVGAKSGAYEQESEREQNGELNGTHEASSELLGPGDENSRSWKIHE